MKIDKLELKYIVPYLPYNLQVEYEDVVCGLEGFDFELAIVERANISLDRIKPLLRPLSDIKEFQIINKEWFTPIERLHQKYYFKNGDYTGIDIDFRDTVSKIIYIKGCDLIPHWMYQDLIKWHFDVFGLIGSGLAIDINSLK